MSILRVQESLGSPTGGERNEKGETIYHRRFTVIASSGTESIPAVLAATGIPRVGDAFPEDGTAKCRDINPSREEEAPHVFRVECEYGPLAEADSGGDPEDPGDNDDETLIQSIRVGTQKEMLAMPVDIHGYLLLDGDGLPLDPPPEIENVLTTVSITRYVFTNGVIGNITAPHYVGKINSAAFMGVDQYYCKCDDATGVRHLTDDAREYWEETWEFLFNPLGFLFRYPLLGEYVEIGKEGSDTDTQSSPGDLVNKSVGPQLDHFGVPIRRRLPRDEDGNIVPRNLKPKFAVKQLLRETDFNVLRMPWWLRVDLDKDERWL